MEWQRDYGVGIGGVEVHVFLVTIGHEKVIAFPPGRQRGQATGVKIEPYFFSGTKNRKAVISLSEQRQHVTIAGVVACLMGIGTGGADVVVNKLDVTRQALRHLPGIAVIVELRPHQRDWSNVRWHAAVIGTVEQHLVPVDLQISGDADTPRAYWQARSARPPWCAAGPPGNPCHRARAASARSGLAPPHTEPPDGFPTGGRHTFH